MATGDAASGLKNFELDGLHDTGREVGHGSYAVVKELKFHGLKCVGKKIHDILFNSATPQEKAAMLETFAGECELLSGLNHPCIVQFLGVYFEQGSPLPVLVMEYLHTTLSACLERYGVLPKEISYGILRDVALGLRFLHEHSPPIIHRDLSANNVLLTSNMNAKLSDLGVAKILNLTPTRMTQMTQTKAPGTPCYMPPEALMAKPKYTSKIDIYSYGVLIIHTLCGRWPFPDDVFRPDPRNPDAVIPISEVERRAEYLQEIGNDHPLMGLIHQCLSNMPARRPEAHEVVSTIMSRRLPVVPNMIELLRNVKRNVSESQLLRFQNDAIRSENQSLRSEVNTLQSRIQRLSTANPHLSPQSESQGYQYKAEDIRIRGVVPPPHTSYNPGMQTFLSSLQPHLLYSKAKLQWTRYADVPVRLVRPQAVLVGEKVYVGGGKPEKLEELYVVFKCDPSKNEWSRLPLYAHPVCYFAMAKFAGNLITVGGRIRDGDPSSKIGGGIPSSVSTGKVYRFKDESQRWEEFLKPMPTGRFSLTVATTQSAIIASGGATCLRYGKPNVCATVEVYCSETSQWYTADPLPVSFFRMTSTIIADTHYLLGGSDANNQHTPTVLYASLTSLVQKATSPTCQSASHTSVWKTLPDTPMLMSAATNLSGSLLAIGGYENESRRNSSAIHVFLPFTNSWVRVTDSDLPKRLNGCTALQLSSNSMIVIGGLKTVFIGTITA